MKSVRESIYRQAGRATLCPLNYVVGLGGAARVGFGDGVAQGAGGVDQVVGDCGVAGRGGDFGSDAVAVGVVGVGDDRVPAALSMRIRWFSKSHSYVATPDLLIRLPLSALLASARRQRPLISPFSSEVSTPRSSLSMPLRLSAIPTHFLARDPLATPINH